jgi:hypothetical protein
MYISIALNGLLLVQNMPCLPNMPLVPYAYLAPEEGNFYFFTEGDQYPHYSRFAGTDELVFLNTEELKELYHAK